jgi:hypothetical protein
VRATADSAGVPPGTGTPAFADSVPVGPLAPGDSATVSFPLPLGALGTAHWRLRLTAVASGDAYAPNDSTSAPFQALPTFATPYADSFEGASSAGAGTGVWARGTPTGGPGAALSGTACWGASLAGGYPDDHRAELYLGAFDLTGLAEPVLRFYHWFDLEEGYDGGRVEGTADGVTWTVLVPLLGAYTAPVVALDGDSAWTGASSAWQPALLDLAPHAAATRFVARLVLATDGSGPRPGWFVDSLAVGEHTLLGVPQQTAPKRLALSPPRPSPSAGTMALTVALPTAGAVRLDVYSVDGRRVATPLAAERAAGTFVVTWDGRREDGRMAASGVYFFRLATAQGTLVRRGVILR